MLRWVAVALGCITALGMQALFEAIARGAGVGGQPLASYGAEFLALILAGFVAGHFAVQWRVLHGAIAASVYILVSATIAAVGEIADAVRTGIGPFGPIDFMQLALSDFVALTAASCGGWLAGQPAEPGDLPRS
jgi:hypothetical protein